MLASSPRWLKNFWWRFKLKGFSAPRVALAPQAGLLLVDEPTAHLDSDTAERVVQALLQLAQGKTLIVATHDPVLAARLGRVVQIGGGL